MNEIITIDARGELIKVYKSTLALTTSPVFKNLIGDGDFCQNKKQDDGSYFIDCDGDVFRHLLAYIEMGIFPTVRYSPRYLKEICDKFAIPIEIEAKKS